MNNNEKLDLILEQLSSISIRMETKFNAIDDKFNSIDARFDAIDVKFDAMDARLDAIDVRLTTLENDVSDIKADLKQFHRYADMILDEVERVHGFLNDHINDTSKHIA